MAAKDFEATSSEPSMVHPFLQLNIPKRPRPHVHAFMGSLFAALRAPSRSVSVASAEPVTYPYCCQFSDNMNSTRGHSVLLERTSSSSYQSRHVALGANDVHSAAALASRWLRPTAAAARVHGPGRAPAPVRQLQSQQWQAAAVLSLIPTHAPDRIPSISASDAHLR